MHYVVPEPGPFQEGEEVSEDDLDGEADEDGDEDDPECLCGSCKFGEDPAMAKRCCGKIPCLRNSQPGMLCIIIK
jgi:hypothetical protein